MRVISVDGLMRTLLIGRCFMNCTARHDNLFLTALITWEVPFELLAHCCSDGDAQVC